MAKPLRSSLATGNVEIVDHVIRRVRSRAKSPPKKARNVKLNVENWKVFERMCRDDDMWPSEVLDDFIALYIERRTTVS